jgi:hypothetical protein
MELLPGVRDPRPDVGELLQHGFALVLAGLLEQQARLRHGLLGPPDLAAGLLDLAVDPVAIALESAHPRRRDELLLEERHQRLPFGVEACQLRFVGGEAGLAAGDLAARLLEPCGVDAELVAPRAHVIGELDALIGDRGRRFGDIAAGQQLRRKSYVVGVIALGGEAGILRQRGVELLAEQVRIGLRLHRLQPEQDLALLDRLRLAHQDLPHDAAFEMLHRLALALDRDPPRRHHGPAQGRERRPDAEAHADDGDRGVAEMGKTAEIGGGERGVDGRGHEHVLLAAGSRTAGSCRGRHATGRLRRPVPEGTRSCAIVRIGLFPAEQAIAALAPSVAVEAQDRLRREGEPRCPPPPTRSPSPSAVAARPWSPPSS